MHLRLLRAALIQFGTAGAKALLELLERREGGGALPGGLRPSAQILQEGGRARQRRDRGRGDGGLGLRDGFGLR